MATGPRFARVEAVHDHAFDYIICGGGTAGLTLAARLSEDPNVSVLVLEAGKANLNDPLILVPGAYVQQFGNPNYDWSFMTTPQKHCDGKQFMWTRGKSLGGSSACNFLSYIRPPAEDIDAWEKLGNSDWNWVTFLEHSRRGERITPPTEEETRLYHYSYNPDNHGTTGELHVGFPRSILKAEVLLQESLSKVGVKALQDGCGGDINGDWLTPSTIDPKTKTRAYATSAFYLPNAGRSNLHVLVEAHVAKIRFSQPTSSTTLKNKTADGVELVVDGQTYFAGCRREVILSAGTLQSPQILELSGIGSPKHLAALGVPMVVDLPGVGENMQDHQLFGTSFELDSSRSWNTYDKLRDPARAATEMSLFLEKQEGLFTMGLATQAYIPLQTLTEEATSLISDRRAKLEQDYKDGKISEGLWEQYQLQLRNLENPNGVDIEYAVFPAFFTRRSKPEPEKSYTTPQK